MNRRELYAFGEPFGDCATRREAGRLICGGGGDSSSSSDVFNSVQNTDNRLAVSNGLGQTGSGNSLAITNTTTDPGALRAMELALLSNSKATEDAAKAQAEAARMASQASASAAASAASAGAATAASSERMLGRSLDFASTANGQNHDSFSALLGVGESMFKTNIGTFEKLLSKQFDSVENTQALTAAAYQQATAEKAGSIDNKTIMVLGLAGAAALAFTMRRKG